MKKIIIIELLIAFCAGVALYFCIFYLNNSITNYQWLNELTPEHEIYKDILEVSRTTLINGIVFLISFLSALTAIILIALKDLPVFKPLTDKLAAHKQAKAQAKAERAEADKQQKIAELEKELQQLKNSD